MNFSGKLVIIIAITVTVLLISNIIAVKPLALFDLPFEFIGSVSLVVSVSVICFPISYIVSDVLTEVYGFRVARGVIWLGFACNLLMVILFWVAGLVPAPGFWNDQNAFQTILGSTAWLLAGGFVAYLVGEFSNSMVMVVLKNRTQGRMLWLRTISSTVVGQGIDSVLFYIIAFGVSGLWTTGEDGSWERVISAAILAWIAKTIYEILATPLTYLVVGWLKRTEQMDIYDPPKSLNPFHIFGDDYGSSVNAAVQNSTTETDGAGLAPATPAQQS